jgi:cytochrome c-type biogenesis protein CcmE
MRKDRRFLAGLIGVGGVVTYLIWTGISGTMLWFVTPAELLARIQEEPATATQSWRVGGMLVPNSHEHSLQESLHRFVVQDPVNPDVQFEVEFHHSLPDTFTDDPTMEVELVMEGTYLGDGRFVATEVLAKCGSRYEKIPEQDVAMTGGVIE